MDSNKEQPPGDGSDSSSIFYWIFIGANVLMVITFLVRFLMS
jgi:hypothetical protein